MRWFRAGLALLAILGGWVLFFRLASAGSLEAINSAGSGSGFTTVQMRGQDGIRINGTENATVTAVYFLVDLGTSITTDLVQANLGAELTLQGSVTNPTVKIAPGHIISGANAFFVNLFTDIIQPDLTGSVEIQSANGFGVSQVGGAQRSTIAPAAGLLRINIDTISGGLQLNVGDWYGADLAFVTTVNVTNMNATGTVSSTFGLLTTLNATTSQADFGNFGTLNTTTSKGSFAIYTTVNATTSQAGFGNFTTLNTTTSSGTFAIYTTVNATTSQANFGNFTTINSTVTNASSSVQSPGVSNLKTLNVTTCEATSAFSSSGTSNLKTLNTTITNATTGFQSGGISNLKTLNVTTCEATSSFSSSGTSNLKTLNTTITTATTGFQSSGISNLTTVNCTTATTLGPTGKVSTTLIDALQGNITTVNATTTVTTNATTTNLFVDIIAGRTSFSPTIQPSNTLVLTNMVGPTATGRVQGLIIQCSSQTSCTVNCTMTSALMQTADATVRLFSGFATFTINPTATTGINGKSTDVSDTTDVWLAVYVVAKADGTVGGLVSSAHTGTPALPSGVTFFAYIGAVYLDASQNADPFFKQGDWAFNGNAVNIATLTGAVTSVVNCATGGFAPPRSRVIMLSIYLQQNTAATQSIQTNFFSTNTVTAGGKKRTTTVYLQGNSSSTGWEIQDNIIMDLDSGQSFSAQNVVANSRCFVRGCGYYDPVY